MKLVNSIECKCSCRMGDPDVYGGAGRYVARLAALLLLVGTEQSEQINP